MTVVYLFINIFGVTKDIEYICLLQGCMLTSRVNICLLQGCDALEIILYIL